MTGLTGTYNLRIEWTPMSVGAPAVSEVSLFTALREQAGLQLEPQKVQVDVVVVDAIDRFPSDN